MIAAELTAPYIQSLLILPFFLMGLSHILQPGLWRNYFVHLQTSSPGCTAVITRTFSLELWPALLIVVFHQVWTGPALLLTVYGHALMVKATIAMLAPRMGMRSLRMAARSDRQFQIAGGALVGLGALCAFLVVS